MAKGKRSSKSKKSRKSTGGVGRPGKVKRPGKVGVTLDKVTTPIDRIRPLI